MGVAVRQATIQMRRGLLFEAEMATITFFLVLVVALW